MLGTGQPPFVTCSIHDYAGEFRGLTDLDDSSRLLMAELDSAVQQI